ncbi:DUF3000 domain-containing protein [Phytoactinopolyspora halophila]|uniref:DUF3000 domain-containing protein n=1 Tax=Phytoactinopolyspora halophila TaxID=1981511 RepID=UPI001B8B5C74|nr:DUF3000 domain-containing protein [Phytoactinopolyspora halophila]
MARSSEHLQPEAPAAFVRAVETLCSAQFRPEVHVDELSPPKRLATYTFALSADVFPDTHPEDDATAAATGRLVLLHEPGGHETWHGEFRLVTYIQASLEPDIGADPMLLPVAWSWLTDALDGRSAPYTAASGTVTRAASEGFGGMASQPATADVEIRASWTPLEPDLETHALAWADALSTAAGLVPLPSGVVAIPNRKPRQQRR